MIRRLLPLAAALFLVGCSMHPLGIDDEEWAVMSKAEQMRAYEQQAELDKVRAKAQAEAQKAKADAEARKYEALAYMRKHARYGDIVQCVLDPVRLRDGKSWRELQGMAVDLVRGESVSLPLREDARRSHGDLTFEFALSGLEVSVCESGYGRRPCDRLLGTSRDFRHGVGTEILLNNRIQGELHCDLKPVRRGRYN